MLTQSVLIWLIFSPCLCDYNQKFPQNFKFGVVTSAYQIEGGWNADGKGESIWDHYTHSYPSKILNNATADVSADSYHKFKEDVKLLKFLEVKYYRFSLSWSRILPTGHINHINKAGVDYYNNLLKELRQNGIEPIVTLYHWDLPQALQDIGGWPNPLLEDYFVDYAHLVFQLFGKLVKYWVTFNEPEVTCLYGYGFGLMAPGINATGIGEYLCAHTILKTHARVYHMYHNEFKPTQKGKISITIVSKWYEPASENALDVEAAERKIQFEFGWLANPIYHPQGDYPQIMRHRIGFRSLKEGFSRSRLPKFTEQEVKFIQGTFDFFGLNTYTTIKVEWKKEESYNSPGFMKDVNVNLIEDLRWGNTSTFWLKVVPWGIRKLLNWVDQTYSHPEIIIFENGFADKGQLEDEDRISYHRDYLNQVLKAIYYDNINVTGYFVWSLVDSFEWNAGYTDKFGLFHVDFNSPNRTRTAKKSALFYRKVVTTKCLIYNCHN